MASQTRKDLRTIATALESYRVDHDKLPYDGYNSVSPGYNYWYLPLNLSTPVAYLTRVDPRDPFRPPPTGPAHYQWQSYRYTNIHSTYGTDYADWTGRYFPSQYYDDQLFEYGGYRLTGAGPDGTYGPQGWPGLSTQPPYNYPASALQIPYDPTNGVASQGDFLRSERSPSGYLNTASD
jgi:hypothetical protein